MKILHKFRKKYGKEKSVHIYNGHIYFYFPKDRWVACDITGWLSWDGKKNEFDLFKDRK